MTCIECGKRVGLLDFISGDCAKVEGTWWHWTCFLHRHNLLREVLETVMLAEKKVRL